MGQRGVASEADMQMAEAAMGVRAASQDANLRIRFHLHPVKDEKKSIQEGRPIFEDQEYVEIAIPGDKDNVSDTPLNEFTRRRFAQQYAAWKASGGNNAVIGTPLDAWPGVSRAQVEELKYFNVRTVEELASLSDTNCQKFAGIVSIRQRARDFVAAAKGEAPLVAMRAELADRDNKISTLEQALREQGKRIDDLGKTKAKG